MKIIENIKGWVAKDNSVKRVAEDIQLTSELILLVRMIYVDGEYKAEELQNFKRICKIAFDIEEEDVPKVIKYLQDFGYETTADDAANMFRSMSLERKKALLLHLLSVAKADNVLHQNEVDMIRNVANLLDVDANTLQEISSTDIG